MRAGWRGEGGGGGGRDAFMIESKDPHLQGRQENIGENAQFSKVFRGSRYTPKKGDVNHSIRMAGYLPLYVSLAPPSKTRQARRPSKKPSRTLPWSSRRATFLVLRTWDLT